MSKTKKIMNDIKNYNRDCECTLKQSNILTEIIKERQYQDLKFGVQNHHPCEWLSILGEEFGEVCKSVCEANFNGYETTGNWTNYRKELVQVAAVAIAMIECYDRNRKIKNE